MVFVCVVHQQEIKSVKKPNDIKSIFHVKQQRNLYFLNY